MENLTLEGQILLKLVLTRLKKGASTYDIYKALSEQNPSYMEKIASLIVYKYGKK